MPLPIIERLFSLRGGSAIVTGGSKGIGKSVALRLAQAGASVMVTGRNIEDLRRTVAEIEACGGTARAVRADVRSASDAEQVVQATLNSFGSLDILVNNAGIFPSCPVLDIRGEQWDEVIETNLKGAFVYAQTAARTMIAAGCGGRIINIASMTAFHPDPTYAAYAVSKGGMISLTQALAIEFAPHKILVNAVAPGRITTDGSEAASAAMSAEGIAGEERVKQVAARVLLGEFGKPEDVANVVLFLASGAANYVTGSVILVDGGYLLT